ncbi:hypothetical protein BV22DRAFT_1012842, partial [Leucogyrophana mollusca]
TKPSSPAECYSLEAVYLAWLLRDAQGAEYVKQARELGLAVGFVSAIERKTVVEWLEGRALDQTQDSPTKRCYVSYPQDVEVVKWIRENQVELRDRNTVLRGVKANNFPPLRTAYADKLKKLKET